VEVLQREPLVLREDHNSVLRFILQREHIVGHALKALIAYPLFVLEAAETAKHQWLAVPRPIVAAVVAVAALVIKTIFL
jgi:hypothetical protein